MVLPNQSIRYPRPGFSPYDMASRAKAKGQPKRALIVQLIKNRVRIIPESGVVDEQGNPIPVVPRRELNTETELKPGSLQQHESALIHSKHIRRHQAGQGKPVYYSLGPNADGEIE